MIVLKLENRKMLKTIGKGKLMIVECSPWCWLFELAGWIEESRIHFAIALIIIGTLIFWIYRNENN